MQIIFLIYSCKASKNDLKDKKQRKNYIFKKIYTIWLGGLWCFNLDNSLPPFSKFSKTKTPLQTTCSQEPRAPSPQLPARGLSSLEKLNINISYLAANYLLLNDCSYGGGPPFFQPVPTHGIEALLWGQWTEITRPVMALPPAHRIVFPHQERKPKGTQFTTSSASRIQILEHMCHLERSLTLSLSPAQSFN